MRNAINFIHGMAYASLILISVFAYGMYTAQLRAHSEARQVALYAPEDYVSALQRAGR